MQALRRFFRREDAATAVEYAVMLGLILAAIVSAVSAVGSSSGGMWGNTQSELSTHGF